MRLPTLPSTIIRLAVNDVSAVERLKKYKIDMNVWHEPEFGGSRCEVCFAGCVMTRRFPKKNDHNLDREPDDFSPHSARKDFERLHNAWVDFGTAVSKAFKLELCVVKLNRLIIKVNKIYETKTTPTKKRSKL